MKVLKMLSLVALAVFIVGSAKAQGPSSVEVIQNDPMHPGEDTINVWTPQGWECECDMEFEIEFHSGSNPLTSSVAGFMIGGPDTRVATFDAYYPTPFQTQFLDSTIDAYAQRWGPTYGGHSYLYDYIVRWDSMLFFPPQSGSFHSGLQLGFSSW